MGEYQLKIFADSDGERFSAEMIVDDLAGGMNLLEFLAKFFKVEGLLAKDKVPIYFNEELLNKTFDNMLNTEDTEEDEPESL